VSPFLMPMSGGRRMNSAPRVSVIIPHYHDLCGLDRCLSLLSEQTYPKDDFEIVVADNGSPEGEATVAAAIAGRAKLTIVNERGAGPARNGGVAQSTGKILAFIDSDCQPEAQWLAAGLRALADYDFVGGRVRVLVENPGNVTSVEAFERVFAFDFKTYIMKKGFAGSGNLFCPLPLFEAVGGFRAGVSEDVDWSRRAVRAGYSIGYAPGAIVGHPARRTWTELTTKWRRINLESYALIHERAGGRLRWLVRSLALPISPLIHTPRVLFNRDLTSFGQRLSALQVLYRLRLWRFLDSFRLLSTAER
jgi:glycosyltransferase involved in cell wall biosynthesis